ncbi:MAG: hypothetical protein CL912_02240 [Deltaproteobacteria bacterium]|nr:hypothetical protein [Deltaproteobacteria bacterium]
MLVVCSAADWVTTPGRDRDQASETTAHLFRIQTAQVLLTSLLQRQQRRDLKASSSLIIISPKSLGCEIHFAE